MKWRYRGNRHYELDNHLGNVQVVITDKKIAHGSDNWEYYTADILSVHDYYAFGQDVEERSFERGTYRYGMNGQEKEDDVFVGAFSAQYWEYDSRIGRRWNLDLVSKPWQGDYVCFSNSPTWRVDPNGDDDYFNADGSFKERKGKGTKIMVMTEGGYVALSKIPLNTAMNRNIVADVVGHYAKMVGISYRGRGEKDNGQGTVGLGAFIKEHPEDKEPAAYTKGQDILVNKNKGKIHEAIEDDYNNLMSVLEHEDEHKKDNRDGKKITKFSEHVGVYARQMGRNGFKNATPNCKLAIIRSAASYLFNARVGNSTLAPESDKAIKDTEDKVNAALSATGYRIEFSIQSADTKGGAYKIYKNNRTDKNNDVKYEAKKSPN
jgi:hypothetical protein